MTLNKIFLCLPKRNDITLCTIECIGSAQKIMVLILKRKTEKTAKEYRLKRSTHRLIDKMQVIMKADQDTVITKACKLLYKDLEDKKTNNKNMSNHLLK